MIKVLREGVHGNRYFEGYSVYDPICSSSTLIQTEKMNILVDPGHVALRDQLNTLLKAEAVKPEDIDLVFVTHHHLDHASNMGSFPKARIFIGGGWVDHMKPHYTVYENPSMMKLPSSVEIIPSPGHTPESMSLLYKEGGVSYICGGDAVREDIIHQLVENRASQNDQYISSLKKIFQLADVIIPGHGSVIQGALKAELHQLIENL